MTTKNFNVKNGLTTGNILLDAASGNITSTNANLGNLATANYFAGNGFYITNIASDNIQGQVANALIAGTVYTNAQPNITSVGTLTSLAVTANATVGNLKTNNLLYANGDPYIFTTSAAGSNTQIQFNDGMSFAGSSGLTFDKGTGVLSVTGNISAGNATFTGALTAGSITTGGTGGNVSGVNYVTANYFSGNGFYLSNLVGGNVVGSVGSAITAGTVTTAAQPNITSVGTLTDIDVSGNAVIGGNLTVNGTTTYVNVDTFTVQDPIVDLGTGPNNSPLTTNDAKDRGLALHYYTADDHTAFMGFDRSNLEFAFGSSVTINDSVVTFDELGNVRASHFIGNGSQLTNIAGGNVDGQVGNALVAGTVYTAAQPNITSVGTLTSLVVGNATANVTLTTTDGNGTVKATGNITAPYFIGNVIGNISGTITVPGNDTAILYNNNGNAGASDNFKFNYTTNVLTVAGNIVGSNADLGNAVVANYFVGNGAFLTGLPAGYSNANVALYLPTYTGNLTGGNATFTGALTAGSITTGGTGGNVSGVNYVTANYFSGNGFYLSNLVGSNVVGTVGSATTAGTITTNAQPNITSVGTLSSVVVSGNAEVGNLGVVGGIFSSKANVTVTTDTVIDQFAPSSYRSAKYHISAKGTYGYQSAEVLLVHDGSTAYITIYGSLCSNSTADIVDFSSNINGVSGNVTLYATTASPSTTVNLVPIYIKD